MPIRPRAQTAADGREVFTLGAKLRATRKAARLSVESLASGSGVSSGLISQLERGQGNPSFLTLLRLSAALDVPLGHFLEGPESSTPMIVRAGERKRLQLPTEHGLVYELLTPNLQGELEVLRSQIPPGFDNRRSPFQHTGEECVHLLVGTLQVCVGGQGFNLAEGDSITYDSGVPHWWRNTSGQGAVILGAVTPPSF
jgi:transcriptional regulator with XRE-family HTH domain